jgi:hypothetical protein
MPLTLHKLPLIANARAISFGPLLRRATAVHDPPGYDFDAFPGWRPWVTQAPVWSEPRPPLASTFHRSFKYP